MSSPDVDSDLIPADEWYDPYLRFALYLGGAFQLMCILAVIFLPSEGATRNTHEDGDDFDSEVSSFSCSGVPPISTCITSHFLADLLFLIEKVLILILVLNEASFKTAS